MNHNLKTIESDEKELVIEHYDASSLPVLLNTIILLNDLNATISIEMWDKIV